LDQELTRRNIQKKADNPNKNYAVGENWQQGNHTHGWWNPTKKTNRLKSVEISRCEFKNLRVSYPD
jgi:hypothetical protein